MWALVNSVSLLLRSGSIYTLLKKSITAQELLVKNVEHLTISLRLKTRVNSPKFIKLKLVELDCSEDSGLNVILFPVCLSKIYSAV